jgi:hypothetical protein
MKGRVARMGSMLPLLIVMAPGCGSSDQKKDPGSGSAEHGACVQTTTSDSKVFSCLEYPEGNEAVLPSVKSSCVGMSGEYTQAWATDCPPNPVSGCQYPAGTFGAPGETFVWYYQSSGGCTSEGTKINPDGTPAR